MISGLQPYANIDHHLLAESISKGADDGRSLLAARRLIGILNLYADNRPGAVEQVVVLQASAGQSVLTRYAALDEGTMWAAGEIWLPQSLQIVDSFGRPLFKPDSGQSVVVGWTPDADASPEMGERLERLYGALADLAIFGSREALAIEYANSPSEVHAAIQRAGYSHVGAAVATVQRPTELSESLYFPPDTSLVFYVHSAPGSQ